MIFKHCSKSSAFFYFPLTNYDKSDITVLGDIVQLERSDKLVYDRSPEPGADI